MTRFSILGIGMDRSSGEDASPSTVSLKKRPKAVRRGQLKNNMFSLFLMDEPVPEGLQGLSVQVYRAFFRKADKSCIDMK